MRFEPAKQCVGVPAGKPGIVDARSRELYPNQDCLKQVVSSTRNSIDRGLEGG